jgi:micrococcal nuclease
MFRHLVLTALLVAAFSIVQTAQAFQKRGATNGIWHPVAAALGGQEFSQDAREDMVLKLSGEAYLVTANGTPDKGTCVVDTMHTPHRMTITGTVGPNQGKIMLAIFEITDKETLRVCYDISGKDFPAEFKSESGTNHFLVEYRKELPAGAEISGNVFSIPDSDVIELLTSDNKMFRVRLNGIDAPELEQPFGIKSKEFLTGLVDEKNVRVITQGEDRSGKIIGDVYFKLDQSAGDGEEINLNTHMVVTGFAWHFVRFAPKNKTLAESQEEAKQMKLGLWSAPNPTAPWDWRRLQAEKLNNQK